MAKFSVGDAVSDAFEVAIGNLSLYTRTQGRALAPTLILHFLVGVLVLTPAVGLLQPGGPGGAVAFFDALGWRVLAFLGLATGLFLFGAIAAALGIAATDAHLEGRRPGFSDAWARVSSRLGPYLGSVLLLVVLYVVAPALLVLVVRLLFVLGVFGKLVAFGLLVPVLAATLFLWGRGMPWLLAPVVAVAADELDAGPRQGSAGLTAGAAGRVFGLMALITLLKRIGHGVVALLVGVGLYFLAPSGASWSLFSILLGVTYALLQFVVSVVLGAVFAAAPTLVAWVLAEKTPASS